MDKDAIKIEAIKAVIKVQGAPGEPKWPEGFTPNLLDEMWREGLVDWIEINFEHRSGQSSLPTGKTTMREYHIGRNADAFLKQNTQIAGKE